MSFSLTVGNDGEHGCFHDFVSGESGSLYELAAKLNLEVPLKKPEVASTKRSYTGIDDYARAHGISGDVLHAAGWKATTYKQRPALLIPTATGNRYRMIDGEKPSYYSPPGYKACWYGLSRAASMSSNTGAIVICNGEISTVAAHHYGLAACCITGGEKALPDDLLNYFSRQIGRDLDIVIALDCDKTGQQQGRRIEAQLKDAGYNATAVDLGLSSGGDLADFCMLYTEGAADALKSLRPLPADASPRLEEGYQPTWTIMHASDLKKLPPLNYLVEPYLLEKSITVLYGESGAGKSFMSLELSLQVAQKEPVVYIAGEGEAGYRKRIAAWCKHNQKSEGLLFMCLGAVELLDSQDFEHFLMAIDGYRPALVVVDTLAMSMTLGDENSSRDMGRVVKACRAMQMSMNSAIVIVHHVNKGRVAERGSNALRGAADTMIKLTPEDDIIRMECSKTKDEKPFPTVYKQLLPVEIDEENSSMVVIDAENVVHTADSLSPLQEKVLQTLALEVFSSGGATPSEIVEMTESSNGGVWKSLSRLMEFGFVRQPVPRGPYLLTDEGRKHITTEEESEDESPAPERPAEQVSMFNGSDAKTNYAEGR